MKIKLDENLGDRGAEIFRSAGHDVTTVSEQKHCGATDRTLIESCHREGRCLVTLDLDFANPLMFEHSNYCGIAVLRLPPRATPKLLLDTMRTLKARLREAEITGHLWIVELQRVREYQPESGKDPEGRT